MEKAFHIQRVAAKIKATERSLDETLVLAADLLVEMRAAQDGLEIGPIITDSAFSKLAEAMTELTQARSSMVTTHRRLQKIIDVAGLQTIAGGTYLTPVGTLDQDEAQVDAPMRAVG